MTSNREYEREHFGVNVPNWRYETTDGVTEESDVTRVHFIYRAQVIQVIDGENGRKGEVTIVTKEEDIPAHEVEKMVKSIVNS